VSVAEIQALIAERGDRSEADMPVEFKQRLLDVLAKDHANTLYFIFDLEHEIDDALEAGDFEMAREKQLILVSITLLETEMRALMDQVMEGIEAETPETATEAEVNELWTRLKARKHAAEPDIGA
jgi:hypothetical protein